MKKLVAIIVSLLCIIIYYVSLDDELTKRLTQSKVNSSSFFRSDKYRYGDLYGMSYLADFRKVAPRAAMPFSDCKYDKEINLYAICDSYIWSFFDSKRYYCGVDSVQYARVNAQEMFKPPLDTTRINVLLIELVERNVRLMLADSLYLANVLDFNKPEQAGGSEEAKTGRRKSLTAMRQAASRFLFNPEVNTNLETNLWDYTFWTPIKETKAAINYRLFGTTDKEVTYHPEKKQLFYSLTIDTTEKMTSSFNHVSDDEINKLVAILNRLQRNARLAKFDTVFLSLIPNPVSIIEPGYKGLTYNRLIERIQNHPDLELPYINVMPDFREHKANIYASADTHWNYYGASRWLSSFNARLATVLETRSK